MSEIDYDLLRARYGYAAVPHQKQELIEYDHKASRFSRVLEHGEASDLVADGTCPLCVAERERTLEVERRQVLLMNDLMGETVFVRSRGYKTMRKATVEVQETYNGKHRILFNWHGETRPGAIEGIRRLDVLLDGERLNVWDDGVDDLSPWEREKPANSAKLCKRTYEDFIQSIH